jgi:hypothetical protein
MQKYFHVEEPWEALECFSLGPNLGFGVSAKILNRFPADTIFRIILGAWNVFLLGPNLGEGRHWWWHKDGHIFLGTWCESLVTYFIIGNHRIVYDPLTCHCQDINKTEWKNNIFQYWSWRSAATPVQTAVTKKAFSHITSYCRIF